MSQFIAIDYRETPWLSIVHRSKIGIEETKQKGKWGVRNDKEAAKSAEKMA